VSQEVAIMARFLGMVPVLCILMAPAAAAQSGPERGEPRGGSDPVPLSAEQFGVAANQSLIPVQHFVLGNSAQSHTFTSQGYYQASGGDATLWAPLGLPPGTDVSQVCVEVFDNDDAEGLTVLLVGAEAGSAGNPAPAAVALAGVTTGVAPTPGYAKLCLSPIGAFTYPLRVRNQGNLDAIGTDTTVQYYILAGLPLTTVANAVMLGPALVTWTRAIRPGPGTADFFDVPVSSAYFQFVEAAATSGIMSPCADLQFCPEAPVTRAQLAMFLSRALGLWWPN
jgi:hypothetical protein